ncbi:MAG TPA: S41 family peptidase [Candidatus Acidoferrales bacterium]|nr:S41 family peptidase [Candidatus Acidoferrales bacterium]
MRRRIFVTRAAAGAAVLAASTSCGQGNPAVALAVAAQTAFPPALLRSDLAYLVETLNDVCVYPYTALSQAAFETERRRLESSLQMPLDPFAFALRVAPLFATLNDGHIDVWISDLMQALVQRGGRFFPLAVYLTEDGAFSSGSAAFGIPDGSRLVSIDAIAMDSLAQQIVSCTPGPSLAARRLAASGPLGIGPFIRARFGARHAFDVRYERADTGRLERSTVRARTFAEISAVAGRKHPNVDYRYLTLAQGTVGYIEYLHCRDLDRFRTFLHQTFTKIKASKPRALIIDIRRNGGGERDLNDELWRYVAEKPFSQGERVSVRLLPPDALLGLGPIFSHLSGDLGTWSPDGTVLTRKLNGSTVMPQPNPLRFHGPTYLLVAPTTFYTTSSCALVAKDYKLATLVGEAMDEPLDANGRTAIFHAPYTRLTARFPRAYFYSAKPHPAGACVQPDVTIKTTAADVRAGRDPVLAYVLAQITRGQSQDRPA